MFLRSARSLSHAAEKYPGHLGQIDDDRELEAACHRDAAVHQQCGYPREESVVRERDDEPENPHDGGAPRHVPPPQEPHCCTEPRLALHLQCGPLWRIRIGGGLRGLRDWRQRPTRRQLRSALEVRHDALGLVLSPVEEQPTRGLRQRTPPPQDHEHGDRGDHLGPAPSPLEGGHDQAPQDRRPDKSEGEEPRERADEPATAGSRHELRQVWGDDRALRTGAETRQHTGDEEDFVTWRHGGDNGEARVEEQRIDHDLLAPDPVAEDASKEGAEQVTKGGRGADDAELARVERPLGSC